jgi:hypothetical protein
LTTIADAAAVESAAHDVITHTRKIFDAATADEHHRVLLEIMALATDVARDLETVG